MKISHLSATISVTALALAVTTPAIAQSDAAATDLAEPRDGLEVVIVTAQKREENLQDVPLAVSAFGADELRSLALNNPTELRYVSPSLNFGFSANVRGEGFAVRGVGTVVFADSIEQSVGVVLDGVPLLRTGQATADLIDIDRVEILRGPQGMLFGKNASAGLINIVTKKPQFENSLDLRASYATLDEIKVEATGNLKLSDTAALRVSYANTNRDGIVENIFRDELLNNRDSQAIRAKLLFNPNDDLSIYVIGDWSEGNQLCCIWTLRAAPAGSIFAPLATVNGITPGPENLQIAADRRIFQDQSAWGVSTEINYDLQWANLTSITAYRRWDEADNNDPDIFEINYLNVNDGNSEVDQFSEELRLTSPGDQRLSWVVGAFFSDFSIASLNEQSGQFVVLPFSLGSVIDSDFRNHSYALFANVSYDITDRLSLIVGGRYTIEDLRLNYVQSAAPGTLGQFPGRYTGESNGSIDEQNLSGRVTAQYQINDDNMIYALWARGYKGPGFNSLSVLSSVIEEVQPEIPTTYEVGMRSTVFGGTTNVNIAGFITNFSDFQASSFDSSLVPSRFIVTNAGKLETRGVEADFSSTPSDGLTLRGALAYVDGTFVEFENIPCYPGQSPVFPLGTPRTSPRQCIIVAGTQAVTTANGLPLNNSPKFTYNIGVDKSFERGRFEFGGGVNWFWRDKVSFSAAGDPTTVQEAYGLLGANLWFGPVGGNWQVSLFAKNLLDQNFANVIFPSPVLNTPGVLVQLPSLEARRILGVALNVWLGG